MQSWVLGWKVLLSMQARFLHEIRGKTVNYVGFKNTKLQICFSVPEIFWIPPYADDVVYFVPEILANGIDIRIFDWSVNDLSQPSMAIAHAANKEHGYAQVALFLYTLVMFILLEYWTALQSTEEAGWLFIRIKDMDILFFLHICTWVCYSPERDC